VVEEDAGTSPPRVRGKCRFSPHPNPLPKERERARLSSREEGAVVIVREF